MIYFIQDSFSKAIKIGHGRKPEKRLAEMQIGCPGNLTLLGTVEGGPVEEALLHDQFDPFHVRGEWFRGDDELLKMIRMMIFAKGKPSTLWDECRRRGGCRSGLKGITIGVIGWSDPWKVWSSRWGADRSLILSIYLADDKTPYYAWSGMPEDEDKPRLISATDLIEGRYSLVTPESFIPDIKPDRCVLLSEWPITCCDNDQRIEDWNH